MGLLSWIFGRTPAAEDRVPEFQLAEHHATIRAWTPSDETPAVIADEVLEQAPARQAGATPFDVKAFWEAKTKIATEPLFCMIDYTDAGGTRTRRRITIRQIVSDPENVWVAAYCHERKAARKFRLDRIRHFITQDGEAIDPDTFMRMMCGFAPNVVQTDAAKDATKRSLKSFNDNIRPALTVLVAASRSDDHVHNEEVDAIMLYAERAAQHMVRAGRIPAMPDLAVFDALPDRINRTRPVRDDVAKAMLRIFDWNEDRFDRFAQALKHVIRADGVITQGESAFLADIESMYRDRWTALAPELAEMVAGSRVFLGIED